MLTHLEKAHSRELKLTKYDWMTLPDWDLRISQCIEDAKRERQRTDVDSDEDEQWARPECDSFFNTAAALKVHAQRAHGWTHKPLSIFDRSRHAMHGLPTCRFGDRRYARWQTLEQHINTLACPKMLVLQAAGEGECPDVQIRPLEPADGKEETDRQSESGSEIAQLPQRPPAYQLLVRQTAAKGLRHFIPMSTTTKFLHQHYGLCDQWVSSHRVMKLHYRNTHPEVFPTLQHNVNRDVERSATACVRCHYCGESQRDWKAHPLKCTTIWQCAVLCVLQDPDHVRWYQHGPGDGRVLRGGEEQRCTGDGANGAGQRQAAPRKPAIFEALGARPSQPLGRLRADQVARKLPFPQRRAPLVYSLARLVIRQEEEIKLLQQDTSMVLWLNSGGDSILHHLYTTAVEFKKKQQNEPTWGLHASQASHGTVHVPGVARPPPEGHQQSIASEQSQGDGLGRRCRLAVNPKLKALELGKSRNPVPELEMSNKLEHFVEHIKRDVVHRFHCTQRLTETMEGKKTFKLHLSVRNKHAEEVWDLLGELQGCCVFQLIGLGYRRERLGRGPMAQKTQEMTRY